MKYGITFIFCLMSLGLGALGWAEEATESEQLGSKRLDFLIGESKGFVIFPTKDAADGSKPVTLTLAKPVGVGPSGSVEGLPVATVRSSIHAVWSTGEPDPM